MSDLTPPHDPGYIKGYPPGVRENGGQYTLRGTTLHINCSIPSNWSGFKLLYRFHETTYEITTTSPPALQKKPWMARRHPKYIWLMTERAMWLR